MVKMFWRLYPRAAKPRRLDYREVRSPRLSLATGFLPSGSEWAGHDLGDGFLERGIAFAHERSPSGNHPRRSPLYGRNAVWWRGSTRRVAASVNYLRRPVSERPAWGWTTLAMLLTNSWFLSETGRKRPPVNVAGAQNGAASRTRRAKQRRGSRENTASCARCGRREALTSGQAGVRRKGLARQVKQRVFCGTETLAK